MAAVATLALLVGAGVGGTALGSLFYSPQDVAGAVTYTVQAGDTLWQLAQRDDTRSPADALEAIRQLNGMTDSQIHPGQQLLLPR